MNKHEARILAGRAKRRVKDLLWDIYGKRITTALLSKPPRSVLFICKGNICRSPFAERLAQRVFDSAAQYGIGFESAGLEVKAPLASPPHAIEAAAGFGVDLEDHRSKGFMEKMYGEFDMIIAMETGQYKALAQGSPTSQAKLFLLPFFENDNAPLGGYERYNVADPYGKSVEEYNRCYQRIERCINGMAAVIKAL
jgi:protein-tyrosine phosphatase